MTDYTTGAGGGGLVGLNWTPGTNVTAQLRSLCQSLSNAGHSLRLEGMFQLTGQRQITTPQNFTIYGIPGVGGLDFPDSHTRGLSGDECMTVTSGCTLRDLWLRATSSPPYNPNAGNAPVRWVDFDQVHNILVSGNNVTIEACRMEGRIVSQVQISGDDCVVRLCEFTEGYYALALRQTRRILIELCWFHEWYVDAIKTLNYGLGTISPLIRRCNFRAGNGRDALDYTGGWYNGVHEDLKITGVRVVAFDIKMLFDSLADVTLSRGLTHNMTYHRVMAVGCNRICTLTHLDNGDDKGFTRNGQPALFTTPANAPTYCPQNITFNDCDWQQYAQASWLLMKGGHTVVTNNCRWRGLTQSQLPAGRTSYSLPKSLSTDDPYYDAYVAVTNSLHYGVVNNSLSTPSPISLSSDWVLPDFQYGPGATDTGEPSIPPAPSAGGPAVSVDPATGVLTVRPRRLPSLAGKQITARARVGATTVSDTFELTNALV